jgi:hypothetical protein
VRVDRAAIAAANEQRQAAGVIDVRVTEHHRINGLGVERKRFAVPGFAIAAALNQPAIKQYPLTVAFQDVAGAGDLARCAEEL